MPILLQINSVSNWDSAGKITRSCLSESSIINYDNVKMLSAIASQQIKRCASCNDAFVGIWHVDEAESTVTKTAWRWQRLRGKVRVCRITIT